MEPDRSLHDRPAASVIAQEYSSAIFVSLRFHFPATKNSVRLKNCFFFAYLKIGCV
jgi:hypothetical protein